MAPRGSDAERHVRPSSPPSTAEAPQAGVAALCPPSLPPGSHAVPPRGVLVVPRMRPDPPVSPSHTLPSRLPSLPTPHVLILPISVPQLSPQVTPITWPKTPRFCPAADAWSVPTPVMRKRWRGGAHLLHQTVSSTGSGRFITVPQSMAQVPGEYQAWTGELENKQTPERKHSLGQNIQNLSILKWQGGERGHHLP